MSDEVRVGCAHRGGSADGTHGIQALNGEMTPAELAMVREEIAAGGVEAGMSYNEVRAEIMSALIGWFFADESPEKPELVGVRIYAVARAFFPSLLLGAGVELSMPVCGARGASLQDLEQRIFEEGSQRDARVATVEKLMQHFFEDRKPENPVVVTRRVYGVVKSFMPELINGASLETLGVWFGEGEDVRRHRARWSYRIKVWVNKAIDENGGVAHAKFQKSASASVSYRNAQMGNKNRLGGGSN